MAFTTIVKTTSWQLLSMANELAAAYNARVGALTSAEQRWLTYSSITPEAGQSVVDFIHKMQVGVERLAYLGWADPSAAIYGGADYIDNLSKSDLFALAGLTETGYWRSIGVSDSLPSDWSSYTDAAYSYRRIGELYGMYFPDYEPDIAGPWLMKDLQLVLSKMTRRIYDPTSRASYATEYGEGAPTPIDPVLPSYNTSSETSQYHAHKAWDYNSPNALISQEVFASYADHTLSGLAAVQKSVKLLVKSSWPGSYGEDYTVSSDFGSAIAAPAYNTTVVSVANSVSTTGTQVTLRDIPAISAWSDLLAYVPTTLNDPYYSWYAKLNIDSVVKFCVDYAFND